MTCLWKDIVNDFVAFLNETAGADKVILVAHNASFDLKFLNHELKNIGLDGLQKFEVIDTLDVARRKFPGQKASLDVLCERFGISLEERKKDGHGALLDSKILADVFLKLMEDSNLSALEDDELDFVGIKKRDALAPRQCYVLTADEEAAHKKFLEENNIN